MIDQSFYIELFQNIDNVLSLHAITNYSSKLLSFNKSLKNQIRITNTNPQTKAVFKKEVTISHILQIIYICPSSYTVSPLKDDDYSIKFGESNSDLINENQFLKLSRRLEEFKTFLKNWVIENSDKEEIPVDMSLLLPSSTANSKSVSSRPAAAKLTKLATSQNKLKIAKPASEFKFKEKKAVKGQSILDKIKEKQKEKEKELLSRSHSGSDESDNKIEMAYFNSKLKPVYNFLYEKSGSGTGTGLNNSYSLKKLSTNIQDSMYPNPIHPSDIKVIINIISERLSENKVSLINIQNVDIVKIGKLDRVKDLEMLK